MAEYIIGWVAVGTLIGAGFMLNSHQEKRLAASKDANEGPPFYDCMGNQQLRETGITSMHKAILSRPAEINITPNRAFGIQQMVRDQTTKARLTAFKKATMRPDHIIVTPNSRKPTYIITW
jgi:hypothetical protein